MIRALVFILMLTATEAFASQACRQALALGLDVSGSVDAREYRLQLDGLAQALDSAAVRAALLEQPESPVALLVYEWSGPQDQITLVSWTMIADAQVLDTVIAMLVKVERRADASPGTALGVAMSVGVQHLAKSPDCLEKTLDISGDGKSNLGPRPRRVKTVLEAKDITINALVINPDDAHSGKQRPTGISELAAYFSAEVILGPDAFIETTLGFESYARAMEIKLLRELDGMVLSQR